MVTYENVVKTILLENASTFAERREILALTESEQNAINNNMIAKLYKSTVDKAYVNFDTIPESKGDITKYIGYKPMVEALSLLKNIASTSSVKISEIDTIEKAINNIIANRDSFERGFKLNKDFIIMQYNVLVCACVEATQITISSYLDYVRKVDKIEFVIINKSSNAGDIAIKNLERFNNICKNGDYSKIMNAIIKDNKNNFTGATAAYIVGGTVLGLIGAVQILRELVYLFYSYRSSISERMMVQAHLLELNKLNLEANGHNIPAAKKKEIIRKQEKIINNLKAKSDKIKVEASFAEKEATKSLKKDSAAWKLDDVKPSVTTIDSDGLTLL